MKLDEVKKALSAHNFAVEEEKRLPNDTGTQLRLATGPKVNIFDNGTVSVQGKNAEPVKAILQGTGAPGVPATPARRVFVVYGHDQNARNELEAMLRRWDVEPLILDQLPSEGMTIIEKLEHYRQTVTFAVVLASPDDEGHRAGKPDEKAFRARQNVVLELGMMLAIQGRSRVAVLLKGQEKMERPSDIQGLIYIPFKDSVREASLQLAKEMNAQGLHIDLGKV